MQGENAGATVQLFTILMAVAILIALASRRIGFPYTLALVLVGLAAAAFAPSTAHLVAPEVVLLVLLPGLVFEPAFQTDFASLRRGWGRIALLAVPGVLITAGIVAAALHLGTGLPFELAFVVGAMVAATDPVAVIAAFKQLDTPRPLTTLVEGESLFNDGTAIVVFAIAVRAVEGPIGVGDAIGSFGVTLIVSVLIGGLAGFVSSRVVARVDDHLIETSVSVVLAYGTYMLADALHESGVIATVVAGITLGSYGRSNGMSERTREAIDIIWEFVAFMLTAIVFLLIGLAISIHNVVDAAQPIAVGVLALLMGRALVTYGLIGGSDRLPGDRSQRLPAGWLHVLFWSGLRGAVAVALALSLPTDFPQRDFVQSVTFGIVLFTLIVQGGTIQWVVRRSLSRS